MKRRVLLTGSAALAATLMTRTTASAATAYVAAGPRVLFNGTLVATMKGPQTAGGAAKLGNKGLAYRVANGGTAVTGRYTLSGLSILRSGGVIGTATTAAAGADLVSYLNFGEAPAPAPAPTPTPTPTPTGGVTWLSGGYSSAAGVAGMHAFEAAIGRKAAIVNDYLDERSWGTITDPSWWLNAWYGAGYRDLVLGVPLTCDGTPLSAVAAGRYDANFVALGKALVAHGFPAARLRLAWEFNGNWYPWYAGSAPAAFVAAFRRVVGILRATAGSSFQIELCISGQSGAIQNSWYPGDDVVDVIGVDAYDWKWGANNGGQASFATRWAAISNTTDGLGYGAAFAKQHGKLLSVPEWGCAATSQDGNGGGGDDPQYVQAMYDWFAANDVAYEAYFPVGDLLSRYPQALARYKSLFG